MNGGRSKGYGVVVVFVAFGLALCAIAWCYVQSVPETAIQRFSVVAAAEAAVAGILAFVALVFYTNETWLLRKAAEDQLEASIKPVVLFDISSGEYVPGQRLSLNAPQLRNIGLGPAFSVAVDPIAGTGVSVNIEGVPLIEPDGERPCSWFIAQDGQQGGMARQPALLDEQFAQGRILDRIPVVVHCKGLSGRQYHFFNEIRIDPGVKVWTEFVRVDSEES